MPNRAQRLALVFSGDVEMNAQIARLAVLYEDLKIEVRGAEDRLIDEIMDENTKQYRELYFVRRAFATVIEVAGAIHKLDSSKEFEHEIVRLFSQEDRHAWKEGVKFFADKRPFLKQQRNLYGGHFHDEAARYAVKQLSSDHVDLVEIRFLENDMVRVILRFTLEFVGLAFAAGRGDKDDTRFIPESFQAILEGAKTCHPGGADHHEVLPVAALWNDALGDRFQAVTRHVPIGATEGVGATSRASMWQSKAA